MRLTAFTLFTIQNLAFSVLAAQPDTTTGPPLVPSRQNFFTIPFTVTPPRTPAEMPREAVLYVSRDRGKSTQVASRVDPGERHFTFRAPNDGEYWFTVKTVDYKGQMIASNQQGPHLRVLVDTVQPELNVEARRSPNSEIEVNWSVRDENIDVASLKIDFQVAGDASWAPVQTDSSRFVRDGSTLSGSATFAPKAAGNVSIQVEISDRAGNRAVSKRLVSAAASELPPLESSVGPRYAVPESTPPIGQQTQIPNPSVPNPNVPNQQPPQWQADGSRVWPPDQISYAPFSPRGAAQTQPRPGQINPPVANQFTAPRAEVPAKQVNSTSFELAYDLGAINSAQVARVDFWGTSDNGQTWTYFGADPDRISPFPLTVPTYGRYGFRIAVQQMGSPVPAPPKPGDPPHMWIDVIAPSAAGF